MSHFVVAGITQLEMIVNVEELPIAYTPYTECPNGITTCPGGDAFNEALAMRWLGDQVDFLSVIGHTQDLGIFNPPYREVTLNTDYLLPLIETTPQEVVLYKDDQHRQIFSDTKDIGDAQYDMEVARPLVEACDMLVLSNVKFCRPFIELAKANRKPIALRFHDFDPEKEKKYADFLNAANILYFSERNIKSDPYQFVRDIANAYDPEIIILGMGLEGLILYHRSEKLTLHYNLVKTIDIKNTHGAGNALFSCFLHFYTKDKDAKKAIRYALLFCSYKMGHDGTSNGFMTIKQLEQWNDLIWK